MLIDSQLHAVLDVDAQLRVGPRQRTGHRDAERRAGRLAVTGRVDRGADVWGFDLFAVRVDRNLLDDLQVRLRRAPAAGLDCVHPAIPMTSNPAAPRATALCVTRPRTCHLHVGVVVGAAIQSGSVNGASRRT